MLDAEDRQAGRAQEQVPGRRRRQAQEAGGQDAELMAVGEQQDPAVGAASSASRTLARPAAASTVSPPGQPSRNRSQSGREARISGVVRPS